MYCRYCVLCNATPSVVTVGEYCKMLPCFVYFPLELGFWLCGINCLLQFPSINDLRDDSSRFSPYSIIPIRSLSMCASLFVIVLLFRHCVGYSDPSLIGSFGLPLSFSGNSELFNTLPIPIFPPCFLPAHWASIRHAHYSTASLIGSFPLPLSFSGNTELFNTLPIPIFPLCFFPAQWAYMHYSITSLIRSFAPPLSFSGNTELFNSTLPIPCAFYFAAMLLSCTGLLSHHHVHHSAPSLIRSFALPLSCSHSFQQPHSYSILCPFHFLSTIIYFEILRGCQYPRLTTPHWRYFLCE